MGACSVLLGRGCLVVGGRELWLLLLVVLVVVQAGLWALDWFLVLAKSFWREAGSL
jgi:hypothetical protein